MGYIVVITAGAHMLESQRLETPALSWYPALHVKDMQGRPSQAAGKGLYPLVEMVFLNVIFLLLRNFPSLILNQAKALMTAKVSSANVRTCDSNYEEERPCHLLET